MSSCIDYSHLDGPSGGADPHLGRWELQSRRWRALAATQAIRPKTSKARFSSALTERNPRPTCDGQRLCEWHEPFTRWRGLIVHTISEPSQKPGSAPDELHLQSKERVPPPPDFTPRYQRDAEPVSQSQSTEGSRWMVRCSLPLPAQTNTTDPESCHKGQGATATRGNPSVRAAPLVMGPSINVQAVSRRWSEDSTKSATTFALPKTSDALS